VRRVRHSQHRRAVDRSKRNGSGRRGAADRRDVIIPLTILDVVFQVRAHAEVGLKAQGPPDVQRAARPKERAVSKAGPAADLLRISKPEANLVAVEPSTLVAIRSDLSVNTGTELEFCQWHVIPLMRVQRANRHHPDKGS